MGIIFRFSHLGAKVYWQDESFTSLRGAGYTEAQLKSEAFNGGSISPSTLLSYQRPQPQSGFSETIHSLALEDAQHPPVYYLLVRAWMSLFGSSPAALRGLAAVCSLFAFPAIYWLCRELFDTKLTGMVAIAVVVTSPFHLLYAQESREYSLWGVTILLSAATFIRAIRLNTVHSWLLYSLSTLISLYTFPLTVFPIGGYCLYLLLQKGYQKPVFYNYLIASGATLFLFAPWLIIFANNFNRVHLGVDQTFPSIKEALTIWLTNLNRIFINIDVLLYRQKLFLLIAISTLLIVCYCIYRLILKAPKPAKRFLLIWMAFTTLPLITIMLMGKVMGGEPTIPPRLLTPAVFGLQISVAYAFADLLSQKNRLRLVGMGLTALTIITGVLSCGILLNTDTVWSKRSDRYTLLMAKEINQMEAPLLIAEVEPNDVGDRSGYLLSLSRLVAPDVRFKVAVNPDDFHPIDNPKSQDTILLFQPTEEMNRRLGQLVTPLAPQPVEGTKTGLQRL
ncbi:MAG: hypothetical protein F6K42_02150 [Leptolyngbya sp. SIO1D8]|nr:hypothetical protein [Leptolyngbya sp. SIO1D8]